MTRSPHLRLAGLVLLMLASAGLAFAEDSADQVLREKGLRKSGSTYVLAAEAEVQKRTNEARLAYKQMTAAMAQQQAYDQGLRDSQQAIRELTEHRIALNNQLAQVSDATENNQLIGMINGVTDRINLIQQQRHDVDAKKRVNSQVAVRRESYVQQVLDLRQLVDTTTEGYSALAEDDAVKQALEQINRRGKAKSTLGPSKGFLNNVALLTKAEAAVLSESVDLRKDGGIFWLDVTFNGKVTRPMAFDTGAADVVLPAELASQIGLRPGPDDPVVKCRVADGSIVEARQMTVPSMRVGKFTVKDVSCTIMPADKKDVPPLLGQTFQKYFMLKFSPDSGKLVLSKVDTPEVAASPARSKSSAKAPARGGAGKRQERSAPSADGTP